LEVKQPGLETSVQDYPGRIGYLEQGFPPSGPMDPWSFRQANIVIGNPPGMAALECQFLGPTLLFQGDCAIAITGADMGATLDGAPVAMHETVHVASGQTLKMSGASIGARSYVAISGGLLTPEVQGSRSTFHMAGIGGVSGGALKAGDIVEFGEAPVPPCLRIDEKARPPIRIQDGWEIEVVLGPNDDWIDEKGHETFFSSEWTLSPKSNRTGFRLEGPQLTFSPKATNKLPEHGDAPSNILDHGYPFGAINLAGQTPIILVNDGPSAGGFINPYTVPTGAFWKLAQSRPGQVYRFRPITVEEAHEMRRLQASLCDLRHLIDA